HERDAVADRRRAVPGAVLGDEDTAPVLLGEHAARVKAHPDRRDRRNGLGGRARELAARASGVVLRIADAVAVAERITKVLARLRQTIQLVGALGAPPPLL